MRRLRLCNLPQNHILAARIIPEANKRTRLLLQIQPHTRMAATPPRASAVERKLQRHTEEVVAVMTNSQAPPAPTRRASMEPKEERKKKKGSSSIGPRPRRAKSTAKEPADPTVSCGCPLDDDDDITPGDPWAAMRCASLVCGSCFPLPAPHA